MGACQPCSGNLASGKKPVITSLAGFASSFSVEEEKPVITSLAGFELSEPVPTEGAAVVLEPFAPNFPACGSLFPAEPQVAASRLATDSRRRLNLA